MKTEIIETLYVVWLITPMERIACKSREEAEILQAMFPNDKEEL